MLTFATFRRNIDNSFCYQYFDQFAMKIAKPVRMHMDCSAKQRRVVVRALVLLFCGPGFKTSTLLLTGSVLGFPGFNSLPELCK